MDCGDFVKFTAGLITVTVGLNPDGLMGFAVSSLLLWCLSCMFYF